MTFPNNNKSFHFYSAFHLKILTCFTNTNWLSLTHHLFHCEVDQYPYRQGPIQRLSDFPRVTQQVSVIAGARTQASSLHIPCSNLRKIHILIRIHHWSHCSSCAFLLFHFVTLLPLCPGIYVAAQSPVYGFPEEAVLLPIIKLQLSWNAGLFPRLWMLQAVLQ